MNDGFRPGLNMECDVWDICIRPPGPVWGPPVESHTKVDGFPVIDVTEGEKNGTGVREDKVGKRIKKKKCRGYGHDVVMVYIQRSVMSRAKSGVLEG